MFAEIFISYLVGVQLCTNESKPPVVKQQKYMEQVQNFPQLVIKFILKNIRISAGRA